MVDTQTQKGSRTKDRRKRKDEGLGPAAKVQTSTLKPAEGGTQTADAVEAAPPPEDILRFFAVGDVLTTAPAPSVREAMRARGWDVVEGDGGWHIVEGAAVDGGPGDALPFVGTPAAPAEAPASAPAKTIAPQVRGDLEPVDGAWCGACGRALFDTSSGRTCTAGHGAPPEVGYWEAARLCFDEVPSVTVEQAAKRMWAEPEDLAPRWLVWTEEASVELAESAEDAELAGADAAAFHEAADAVEASGETLGDGLRAAIEDVKRRQAARLPEPGPSPFLPPFEASASASSPSPPDRRPPTHDELQRLGQLAFLSIAFDVSLEEAAERLHAAAAALRGSVLKG